RHAAVEAELARVVDRAHPTLAQLAVDEAAADGRADEVVDAVAVVAVVVPGPDGLSGAQAEGDAALRAALLIQFADGSEAMPADRADRRPLGLRRGQRVGLGDGLLLAALDLRIALGALEELGVEVRGDLDLVARALLAAIAAGLGRRDRRMRTRGFAHGQGIG